MAAAARARALRRSARALLTGPAGFALAGGAVTRAVPVAHGVEARHRDRAGGAHPPRRADARVRDGAVAVAVAAGGDGAVHADEAGDAEARALDALALVRAEVRAEVLAGVPGVPRVAVALVVHALPVVAACLRARRQRHRLHVRHGGRDEGRLVHLPVRQRRRDLRGQELLARV